MQTMKKLKIILKISYIVFLGIFLYLLITKIGLKELTSYSFIKSNTEYLIEFRQNNLIYTFISFVIFGIIWISVLQGFGFPLGLICGFIFATRYIHCSLDFTGTFNQKLIHYTLGKVTPCWSIYFPFLSE